MKIITLMIIAFALTLSAKDKDSGVHLFILSGQSNIVFMKPNITFTPMVEKEFGKENTIVVKDAAGGRPIRLWAKNYTYPEHYKKSSRQKGMADFMIV